MQLAPKKNKEQKGHNFKIIYYVPLYLHRKQLRSVIVQCTLYEKKNKKNRQI